MHVRKVVLGIAGRPRLGDRLALGDVLSLAHEERAEVREGGLVTIAGDNGDREPVRRDPSREAHLAGRGRADRGRAAEGDVDPAMLPARVRVAPERELAQHGAVGRPGPGGRPRGARQGDRARGHDRDHRSRCPTRQHESTVATAGGRRQPS